MARTLILIGKPGHGRTRGNKPKPAMPTSSWRYPDQHPIAPGEQGKWLIQYREGVVRLVNFDHIAQQFTAYMFSIPFNTVTRYAHVQP